MRKLLALFLLASSVFAQQQVQPVAGVLTLNLVPGTSSFKVILSANVTSVVIQNPTPGTIISVIFTENATGGFTVTFGGNIANPCTVVAAANTTTTCQFQYDATSNTWNGVGGGGGGAAGFLVNVVDPTSATYGAKFDGVLYYDVSTASSSPTVTCPNSDCAFTSAMVGRQAWVVNGNGCNGGGQCTPIIGTVGSAPPTVVSVGGAQSITLSANASGVCTAACAIIVADDDTTALNNAYNAASGKCGTLQLPAGIAIVSSALFGDPSGTSTCSVFAAVSSRQATTVKGYGSTSTILVPSINFNMASCTLNLLAGQPGGACFGAMSANAHGTTMQGFSIYGMGLNIGSSANNKVGIALGVTGHNYTINDVQLLHWNAGSTGSIGLLVGGGTTILEAVEVDGFNNTPCAIGGSNILLHGTYFCGDSPGPGLNVINTNTVMSTYGGQYCSTGNPVVQLSAGIIWSSFNEQFEPAVCGAVASQKAFNGSTGTVALTGANVQGTGASDVGVSFTGGTFSLINSVFNESGTSAACFNTASAPTFVNLGGNTITCTNLLTAGSTGFSYIADGHSVKAICTGVATSSSTLALISTGTSLTGTALTTACTGTTLDKGIPVNGARTLAHLICTSSATTVSVACTAMTSHNGAAFASSGITCTMTAAISCVDGTHTLVVADGDLVTVQIVTGAAETGANIKAIVEWN